MRPSAAFIASLVTAALAQSAVAAVTYHSQYREISALRSTLPPFGSTVHYSAAGVFTTVRATSRQVQWMGTVYLTSARTIIQSDINASGISASGSLQATGTPITSPSLQGPIARARVEVKATFSVDIDTPFNLIASTFPVRATDLFILTLTDAGGNDIIHAINTWPDTPISFSGTLTPGQYSFRYLAELNSGSPAATDYAVTLSIPAPAPMLLLPACAMPLVSRNRRTTRSSVLLGFRPR